MRGENEDLSDFERKWGPYLLFGLVVIGAIIVNWSF
jgi:hypothetical protein